MKYFQIKEKAHLNQQITVAFEDDEYKKVQGNFGDEYHRKAKLVAPSFIETAPKKDGTRYTINQGDSFYFVMTLALGNRLQEYGMNVPVCVEMHKTETGSNAWAINKAEEVTQEFTYTDKDDIPFGARERNDATMESEDEKWDRINRKKREEIAHGQAFNIATMTVNGANPKAFWVSRERWLEQVRQVAYTIKPYLVKNEIEKPNFDNDEEPVEVKTEKVSDDQLPF